MNASSPPTSVIKSAGRVLEVFEHLRALGEPQTATAIGRALGWPKSSTNALLKSLVALGYLSFDSTRLTYFPTLRVTQLGEWLPPRLLGGAVTGPLLDELHQATGETITLSMQNDQAMQLLRVLPGTFPIALQVSEGYRVPLFGTGIGAAFLSTLEDEEIRRLAERPFPRGPRRTVRVDLELVLRDVRAVRRQGWIAAYDRLTPDTGAIAMPLPTPVEGRSLVIAVAGLSVRMRRNEGQLLRSLRRAVARHFPDGRAA